MGIYESSQDSPLSVFGVWHWEFGGGKGVCSIMSEKTLINLAFRDLVLVD